MQDNKNTVVFKVLSISSKYVLPGGKKKKKKVNWEVLLNSGIKKQTLHTCEDEEYLSYPEEILLKKNQRQNLIPVVNQATIFPRIRH